MVVLSRTVNALLSNTKRYGVTQDRKLLLL